jgi:hypothetical protein
MMKKELGKLCYQEISQRDADTEYKRRLLL